MNIMGTDLLRDLGPAYLGSRLKRLGERMQAGASQVAADAGLPMQPGHMPVLEALDGRALSIGELVQAIGISQPGITRSVRQLAALGLVATKPCTDQRKRVVTLTPAGQAAFARARVRVMSVLEDAVCGLTKDRMKAFMRMINELEVALAQAPLEARAATVSPAVLTLREFDDSLAGAFRDINREWIEAMFHLEATDAETLDHPREKIVDAGGVILFVEARGLGVVGAGALMPVGRGHAMELTKLGVRESARGLKAGEFLLQALIERAKTLRAKPLFLLTNRKCAAAVHLYEKHGFRHDADILQRYGAEYERCDVAMRYAPGKARRAVRGLA